MQISTFMRCELMEELDRFNLVSAALLSSVTHDGTLRDIARVLRATWTMHSDRRPHGGRHLPSTSFEHPEYDQQVHMSAFVYQYVLDKLNPSL